MNPEIQGEKMNEIIYDKSVWIWEEIRGCFWKKQPTKKNQFAFISTTR